MHNKLLPMKLAGVAAGCALLLTLLPAGRAESQTSPATPLPTATMTATSHIGELHSFAPTPTPDPAISFFQSPHYLAARAALDTARFEPLPPVRNQANNGWVFRWKESWTPPNLDNILGLVRHPGGRPYLYRTRLVIQPYPFEPSPNPALLPIDAGIGEMQLLDLSLKPGLWYWSVRGEYVMPGYVLTTDWMPWQEMRIPDIYDPIGPVVRGSEHYRRAKAALDTVTIRPLPVIRDANKGRWIFRWEDRWTPPDLTGVPGLTAIPYTYQLRFAIRHYPFDIEDNGIAEYVMLGNHSTDYSDIELASGTWYWSVRAEYITQSFWLVSDWMPWQKIEIVK